MVGTTVRIRSPERRCTWKSDVGGRWIRLNGSDEDILMAGLRDGKPFASLHDNTDVLRLVETFCLRLFRRNACGDFAKALVLIVVC